MTNKNDATYSHGTQLSQGAVEMDQTTTKDLEGWRSLSIKRLLASMSGKKVPLERPGDSPAEEKAGEEGHTIPDSINDEGGVTSDFKANYPGAKERTWVGSEEDRWKHILQKVKNVKKYCKITDSSFKCGNCGAETNDSAFYCADCGKEFKPMPDSIWLPLDDKEILAPRFAKSSKMKKIWADVVKKHGKKATKGGEVNYGTLVAIYKNKGGKVEK